MFQKTSLENRNPRGETIPFRPTRCSSEGGIVHTSRQPAWGRFSVCGVSELDPSLRRRVSPVKLKLNISFPATGCQKLVDNERKPQTLKLMATEVAAGAQGGGLCRLNERWEQQARLSHEARCVDPWQCAPVVE